MVCRIDNVCILELQHCTWHRIQLFVFKKAYRNKVYSQIEGFRMTPMASNAAPGAAESTLDAGKVTGRW